MLHDLLTRAARRWPDKTAVVAPGGAVTFAALDRRGTAIARHLQGLGIGPGDRVALMTEPSLDAIAVFWGVLRAGATTVDIAPSTSPSAMDALVEAAPRALAAHAGFFRGPGGPGRPGGVVLPGCPDIVLITDAVPAASAADDPVAVLRASGRTVHTADAVAAAPQAGATPLPRVPEDAPALCVYTSGTTGRQKGVLLSHHNLLSNLAAYQARIALTAGDSLLLVAPLHYIHGRIQLLLFMMLGGTVVVSRGFRFPQVVVQELERHRITCFSGVPYHVATLLTHSRLATTPLPHLRHLMITGGALAPDRLRALQAAVPGAAIHLNYGLTEASPRLTYHGPSSEVFSRPTSCGRPLPGVTIEILGPDDEPLPPGVVGEVVAGGPGIMLGYVSGDERRSGRIDGRGRLRTGDLGHLDADGYLHLQGRRSDMIKTAGERLFPAEIEQVLATHPDVAEAAAFGEPDPQLGERVVACVVAAPGRRPDPVALRRHCLAGLPLLRVPREIRVVAELPKTASGKVRRDALRAAPDATGDAPGDATGHAAPRAEAPA